MEDLYIYIYIYIYRPIYIYIYIYNIYIIYIYIYIYNKYLFGDNVLTLNRMYLFQAAHGWRYKNAPSFPEVFHTCPTLMKPDKNIASLKKIQENIWIT